MKIGIIGRGREGMWWKSFLKKRGYTVLTSDSDEETGLIIPQVEVIIIAVPMNVCVEVARCVAIWAVSEQLILSVCGVMSPVEKGLRNFRGSYAFLHRMIGPQVETMKGHTLVTSRIANLPSRWLSFVRYLLRELEGDILEVSPEEHDRKVDLTQGMIRVLALSIGKILREDPTLIKFGNVPFDGLMLVLKRIIDFGPELSHDMIRQNPFSAEWITTLHTTMVSIEKSGPEEFEQLFQDLQALFGKDSVKADSKALADTLTSLRM